jgi:hypothetical protein
MALRTANLKIMVLEAGRGMIFGDLTAVIV